MKDSKQVKQNTQARLGLVAQWRAWAHSLTQRSEATGPQAAHLRRGQAAEALAAKMVTQAGLKILARNYKTPGRGGGEIDIIARDGNTLVFIEVRSRSSSRYGHAGSSIQAAKQQRWRYAAAVYIRHLQPAPMTRFDAILFDGEQAPQWLRSVF